MLSICKFVANKTGGVKAKYLKKLDNMYFKPVFGCFELWF